MEKLFCPLCEREFDQGIKFCPHDASPLIVRSKDAMAGQIFDGRYRILHKLGEGGMGAVYKALQISTNKPVAIKVVAARHTENENTIQRFQREVKLQSRLEHPNIVTVLDFAKTPEGQYFFAMPFIEGKSLRQMILDNGKFPIADFLSLAMQICDGLECAHGEGVVHRDIKSDNIVVAHIGSQRVAKILDFGLAKAVQQDGDATRSGIELSSAGMTMGTPAYMSPEQVRGEAGKIGPLSDLYSLGVIFYQMLTGTLPFRSDTPWGVMHQHISEPPVPLRQIAPDVPEIVEQAVMRCLEKEPGDRYASALELRRDLAAAAAMTLAGRTEEMRVTPSSGFPKMAKEKPASLPWGRVAAALVLFLGVSVGLYWVFGNPAPKQQSPAPLAPPKPAVPAAEKKGEPNAVVKDAPEPAPLTASAQAEKDKREKVEYLLIAAQTDVAINNLITPKGDNAMEKYREALALDPSNADAKMGMDKIAARAVELAQAAMEKDQEEMAEEHLAVAESVRPGYAPATKARENFSRIRQQRAELKRNMGLAAESLRAARESLHGNDLGKAEDLVAKTESLAPNMKKTQLLRAELEKKKKTQVGMAFVSCGKFFMDKYEVTQADYEKVMGTGRWADKGCPNCPVQRVNWDEANAYCGKLGKRLPDEREWEMAARSCKDNVEYATASGSLSQSEANYKDAGLKKAAPVGSYKPNPMGLHDMSGNVWEWTSSSEGPKRILRGGSWNDKSEYLKISHRFIENPAIRASDNGFRCAK
jgi:serine/threonine-protein kinase